MTTVMWGGWNSKGAAFLRAMEDQLSEEDGRKYRHRYCLYVSCSAYSMDIHTSIFTADEQVRLQHPNAMATNLAQANYYSCPPIVIPSCMMNARLDILGGRTRAAVGRCMRVYSSALV